MAGQIKSPETTDLLASAARTETLVGSGVRGWRGISALIMQLAVTAKDAAAGDKLDVIVQTTVDGTNWFDIYHFAQLDGATSAPYTRVKVLNISDAVVAGGLAQFLGSSALGASANRPVFGFEFRAKITITNGTGNHSWTFSVKICPMVFAPSPGME